MFSTSSLNARLYSGAGTSCSYGTTKLHHLRSTAVARTRFKQPLNVIAAAERSFYQVLEVDRNSDLKAIKKAYKKKALKYHPDVNKEPDAKELFMECKTAYQTLANEKRRQEYDRTLNGGTSGFDWGSFGDAFKGTASSTSQKQRTPREKEEFYGFEAFFRDLESNLTKGFAQVQSVFRDLEKDFQDQQAKRTGQPKSLWQEVRDIGEEFVEFLEQEVASIEKGTQKSQADHNQEARAAATQGEKEVTDAKSSAEEQARQAQEAAETSKRKAEAEIDDMLAELKRGLNSQQ